MYAGCRDVPYSLFARVTVSTLQSQNRELCLGFFEVCDAVDAVTVSAANMELRSGIYKGVHGTLPGHYRGQFTEGVSLLFSRWTALGLAIDNEWGGSSSRQKAEHLYEDVLQWFFTHSGKETGQSRKPACRWKQRHFR